MPQRPTQAHMTQSWPKNRPEEYKDLKKNQMKYYMGAKLIEVGVDPSVVVYRWSMEIKGTHEVWTCSTYWGEAKETLDQ